MKQDQTGPAVGVAQLLMKQDSCILHDVNKTSSFRCWGWRAASDVCGLTSRESRVNMNFTIDLLCAHLCYCGSGGCSYHIWGGGAEYEICKRTFYHETARPLSIWYQYDVPASSPVPVIKPLVKPLPVSPFVSEIPEHVAAAQLYAFLHQHSLRFSSQDPESITDGGWTG